MNALRRTAPLAGRTIRASIPRQQCRAAHSAHHPEVKESFGTGFYVVLGILPATFVLYKLAVTDGKETPWLTQWIDSYSNWKQDWVDRNDLHTKLIQKAAEDRNLFFNSASNRHVDLRFPEAFNTGSPFSVPAGSVANIDKVIAHYEKKNYEEQASKVQAAKDETSK